MTTRAIISGSGSLLHPLGHWITEQLRPVTLTMPRYLTSSYALKEDIVPLTLPPNACVFTCNCKAMFLSIPLEALDIIEDHLHSNNSEFEYDADAFIDGLKLLMENMLFQFGDLYYKQTSGTTMGEPPASDYTNIFFGIHEMSFLPEFKDNLKAYRCFIHDIFGIWIPHPDPAINNDRWNNFKSTVNSFHGLEWVLVEQSNSVNFIDLTISLDNGKITTKVYEKPMSLHQYIPPYSVHPPGMARGLVIGQTLYFHQLCSLKLDAHLQMKKLYKRLQALGHTRETLLPLFAKGLSKARKFLALPHNERLQSTCARTPKHDSFS